MASWTDARHARQDKCSKFTFKCDLVAAVAELAQKASWRMLEAAKNVWQACTGWRAVTRASLRLDGPWYEPTWAHPRHSGNTGYKLAFQEIMTPSDGHCVAVPSKRASTLLADSVDVAFDVTIDVAIEPLRSGHSSVGQTSRRTLGGCAVGRGAAGLAPER